MKINKKILSLAAIVIGITCLAYVAYSLCNDDQWLNVITNLHVTSASYALLCACAALMLVNWLLESKKWQFLTAPLQPLSTLQAMCSVLAGVAVGTITPNRVGELGGRTLLFTANNKGSAALLAAIGSIVQLLVTIVCGLVAMGVLLLHFKHTALHQIFIIALVQFAVLFGLLWFVFKNGNHLSPLIERISSRFNLIIHFKSITLNSKQLGIVFTLSFVRYAIFLLQFVLLLMVLGFTNDLPIAICSLGIAYVISAAIPSGIATDLGIKGASVLWVMQQTSTQASVVVTAVFLLWIINVALPSVAGSIILLQHRKVRNKVNESTSLR